MALGRTLLMAWLLAVLSIAQTQTEAYPEITAFTGKDTILPCQCSTKTVEVVWQDDNHTVVNHYKKAETTHEPGETYKNRSMFLNIEEGDCSLRLLQITESDEKMFTCYTIDENDSLKEQRVYLKISNRLEGDPTQSPDSPPNNDKSGEKSPVGASLSLVAVMVIILAFIIIGILLMRRRRQNNQRMANHLDPQSGLPMMNHSPV